jgi:hypothetical protein
MNLSNLPKVVVEFTGIYPLLQNRDDINITNPELAKKKAEGYVEYEERVWREKAHWSSDTPRHVAFPSIWIRKMLIASQRQNAEPIRPASSRMAKDSLLKHYTGGILFTQDPVLLLNNKPVLDGDLVPFKKMVSPVKGKVLCIRPMIREGWTVRAEINILNEQIRPEHIKQSLEWAGTYNGCGDWRVEKGGNFGMFHDVKIIK